MCRTGTSDVIATNRTDENGKFSLPIFFAGSFDLKVEKEGFKFVCITNIQARLGHRTVPSEVVMDPGIVVMDPGIELNPEIALYYVAPISDTLLPRTSRP